MNIIIESRPGEGASTITSLIVNALSQYGIVPQIVEQDVGQQPFTPEMVQERLQDMASKHRPVSIRIVQVASPRSSYQHTE